ncbi:bifunctional diguanylate cyclase/phosphodiesterase [Deinococcus sp. QL22]|uniref:putative bifunctional diguanylate cyclase/phosphodiesterase n=1 Tax=Deinococcus sp. QL22 TaxID=2939437 RepID=UPI0020170441|nr:GGDEF domain-containing protein [Deinococcus sp. QL22]UQN09256.1 EAL domain-containing protein [Deinococcus sp. QL22]
MKPIPTERVLDDQRNAILEMTVRHQPLEEILQAVSAMLEGQLSGYACSILLVQDGRLWVSAGASLPPAFNAAIDGLPVEVGQGSCGTAAATQQLFMIEDTLTHPFTAAFRDLVLIHGLRTCLSLPVLNGQHQVLGTIALYGWAPGSFASATIEILEQARALVATVTEHHHLTESLRVQAFYDVLTGLPNRRLFGELLQAAAAASSVALLLLDVDDFKGVNDTLGHQAGDQTLCLLVKRLQGCLEPEAIFARLSGDEFTVAVPGMTEEQAVNLARQFHEALVAAPFVVEGMAFDVRLSVGISMVASGEADLQIAQRRADTAMYHAKRRKLGYSVFRSEMLQQATDRLHLAVLLRQALERQQLEVHYQTQHDLQTHRIIGLEALVRWIHPDLGTVPPGQFIPVAEETGLIVDIGHWVLRTACQQGQTWRELGHTDLRIAVNVSSVEFERPGFVKMVAHCLQETGFPAQCLELELTERVVMHDLEESTQRIAHLQEMGISIALDDFGAGYSSLNYVARLPLSTLKIDRAFVRDLQAKPSTEPIVRAILALADTLGLRAVAEGIETAEQLVILQALGCQLGQGFFFHRPEPPHRLWLKPI